ncbi:hypothetical protein CI109_105703 [Kwoniella shandongensis]|uniref:Uncharacterized protein n=1 Tax=Kwoniella shandongensis TaxID=1734106 RepID=A0A5M6C1D7_9TREE|nr:uncharacterized protein CI109_003043 [Kwoniella shandongensis]KAA5528511.1 hypothetical protein CI109_003043 [Kwoniella shandongensis]
MEMYQGSSTQQPAAICALKSPADAIHILEAVRLGIVPRVTRRLTGHERAMIRPGTVWVWEEEETNMRRWTDGRRWGASRVGGGGFLVYTESSESLSPPPSRPESPYHPHYSTPSSSRRPESLIKQTYSTTMTHPVTSKVKKFHVVAYSSKHNPQGDAHNPLPLPHQLPTLSLLKVTPGIWPEWENRREPEYPVRRPGSSSQTPFPNASHSAPATAISSPNGSHYSVLVPPTAYPGPRPPSPRQENMYARPLPPPFPRGPYDGRPAPQVPSVRGPGGPYTPPYQQSPRRDVYDPQGYPGRHLSQPPLGPSQSPTIPQHGTERYHPYAPSARSSSRVPSYPPSTGSSTSTGVIIPGTPSDAHFDREGAQNRQEAPRVSPPQAHPFAYSRPPSSSGDPGKMRQYQEYPMSSPAYSQDRTSPEINVKPILLDNIQTDPRRYPSSEQNPNGHTPRNVSAPTRLPPSAGRTSTSPNQSLHQLQPPESSTPTGRSPKMSISSTLLNHDGGASNAGNSGPGLTLPPLRVTFDEREGGAGGPLSSAARPSPHGPSVSGSPSDKSAEGGAKTWGEDARQLGELGRRVML